MLDVSVGSDVLHNVLKEASDLLMALLAKAHATKSRISIAVTRTLKKMADDDRIFPNAILLPETLTYADLQ